MSEIIPKTSGIGHAQLMKCLQSRNVLLQTTYRDILRWAKNKHLAQLLQPTNLLQTGIIPIIALLNSTQ